jgi:hypothetical protein
MKNGESVAYVAIGTALENRNPICCEQLDRTRWYPTLPVVQANNDSRPGARLRSIYGAPRQAGPQMRNVCFAFELNWADIKVQTIESVDSHGN